MNAKQDDKVEMSKAAKRRARRGKITTLRKTEPPKPAAVRTVVVRESARPAPNDGAYERSVKDAAAGLMLPRERPNMRIASAYSTTPTAVATVTAQSILSVDTANEGSPMCVSGSMLYVVGPSLTCAAIEYQPYSGSQIGKDLVVYDTGSYSEEAVLYDAGTAASASPYADAPFPVPFMAAIDDANEFEYACTVQGTRAEPRMIYLDLGTLDFELTYTDPGATFIPFDYQIWYYDGANAPRMVAADTVLPPQKKGVTTGSTKPVPATGRKPKAAHLLRRREIIRRRREGAVLAGQYVVLQRGYYWISVGFDNRPQFLENTAPITFSASWTQLEGESRLMHKPLADLATNVPAITAACIAARDVTISNLSAVLTLGGGFAASVVKGTWLSMLAEGDANVYVGRIDPYTLLAQIKDVTTMRADNGISGFVKPTSDETYEMRQFFSEQLNVISDVWSPISSPYLGQLIFGLQVPLSGVGLPVFSAMATSTVVYQTDDVWRATAPPTLNWRAFQDAVQVVRDVEQFHENPLHINAIMRDINNVVSGAGKITRNVAKQVNMTAPAVRKALANIL